MISSAMPSHRYCWSLPGLMSANGSTAIATASVAAFSLERIEAREWRQAASLLSALRGRLGLDEFMAMLEHSRGQIVPAIGVEGYESINDLIDRAC